MPRAGIADVVADHLVGKSYCLERAGPEFASFFKDKNPFAAAQPANEAARIDDLHQVGTDAAKQHGDIRFVHHLVKAVEYAHADGVGIADSLNAQDDDAGIAAGGFGNGVQVLF